MKSELQPFYEKAYEGLKLKANIKGFRKGKVPLNIIKQYYGKSVDADVIEDAANEALNNLNKEGNIKIIGQPTIVDVKNENDLTDITVIIETVPEFELGDYHSLELDEPFHKVSDHEIDHEIEHLCMDHGKLEPADQISDDLHIAGLTLREIDPETKIIKIDKTPEKTEIFLHDHHILPELKENLLNLKVGDTFDFRPGGINSPNERLYQVTVDKIQKLVPRELDDQWVTELTNGKFTNVEDYTLEVGFRLQEMWDQRAREMVESEIMTNLIEKHTFEAPPTMMNLVTKQLYDDITKKYKDQKATFQELEPSLRNHATRLVRWELIKDKIIEKEKIEIEDFDIDDLFEKMALPETFDKSLLKNQVMSNDQVKSEIITKKLFSLILDFATTNEVSFEEFESKHRSINEIEINPDYEHGDMLHDHDHDHHHDHDHVHDHDHDHDLAEEIESEVIDDISEELSEKTEK